MNWSQYNKSLKERGSLNFWINENIAEWWYSKKENQVGRPPTYSDKAIEICLRLRAFFKLPLRAVEGFVASVFKLSNLELKVPSYTQISRRTSSFKDIVIPLLKGTLLNIAIDSTGLKVFGEGEWKVRQHGVSRRRTWRKLHIALDVDSQKILGHALTTNDISDGHAWNELSSQFQDIAKKVYADGAYDQTECYENIRKIGAQPVIPPRRGAKEQKDLFNPAKLPRDHAIAKIKLLGNDEEARKKWKKETGYHQRSLSETAMFRFKQTFGASLQSRKFKNQVIEASIKIDMLNKMASLGMPKNM